MNKKLLLLFIAMIGVMTSHAQIPDVCFQKDSGAYIRDHQVDFTRLKLEVSFVPQQSLVKGRVTEYFTPLRKNVDTIYFDGPGIKIFSCTINGKPAIFDTTSRGVYVHCNPVLHWNTEDSVTFVYQATPSRGIYFYGWNDPKNILRKQIWTQGEGTDNRNWIPMYDEPNDKMITEMIVTFDKNYNVLSNGTKISEKLNADGTKTWHYRISHPMSSYLIMLAIGDYAVKTAKSSSGVPMQFWYYPDEADRVQPTYQHSTEMMDFLESETGLKYPWESYSQVPVENYVFGAMENTTATVFGDFYLNDKRGTIDRAYAGVDAHEMTHQWFGDYITCRSWVDMWMHENFATYYAKLFDGLKLHTGEDYYVWNRRGEQDAAVDASKSNLNPIRNTNAGNARVYPKGSAVLDMLSNMFGHDAFKRAIHCYLVHNRYANVDINDFVKAFKDTLGLNLDWFFDEWIVRGGEPAYSISYKVGKKNAGDVAVIDVKQTQKITDVTGYFKMPINFEVYYTDGSRDSVQQWISHAEDSVVIPVKKQISFVLFDPDSWIIKSVSFPKSFTELQNQVRLAPHAIDRFDALVAMRDSSINLKRNLLISEFNHEQFHGMREEVVRQLAKDKDPNSVAVLQKAFSDKDAGVRQAVINAIDTVTIQWYPYFEQALHDSSYIAEQEVLIKLSLQYPANIAKYLDETKNDYGIDNGLRSIWLEIKALRSSQQAGVDSAMMELTNYASGSYEFRTRMNALSVIKEMNVLTPPIVADLFDAALSNNWHLAGDGKKVLDYYYDQLDKKKLIQDYYTSQTFTPAQQKLVSKYGQ
jgi:aminopeptidase N